MTSSSAQVDTLAQLLQMRESTSPSRVAFQCEDGQGQWQPTTWAEFGIQVRSITRALWAAGLRKGDRMAIVAPISLQWELLHHAALGMGVVVVGMDEHDLPERIAAMARQADIAALAVANGRILDQLGTEDAARIRLVLLLARSSAEHSATPRHLKIISFEDLAGIAMPVDTQPPRPGPADIATIIFTSGTTGAPRGIAYTHSQVCLAVHLICEIFDFVQEDDARLLCWLPLSNLFQRMVNLAAIGHGVVTYLLGDPRRIVEKVANVSPDVFVGVPRFFEKLYEGINHGIARQSWWRRRLIEWARNVGRQYCRYHRLGVAPPRLLSMKHGIAETLVLVRLRALMGSRLRCMVTGSAPTSPQLLEELFALGWIVLEAYGLSENVVPMAMNRMGAFRLGTVGRPLACNEILVDGDGVIRVKGPGVFSGYLGDNVSTLFDEGNYFVTGDIGRFDEDGFLRLTGRSSEIIKTSTGRRIAPAGVEVRLRAVNGIDQAILVGNGRKCPVALCSVAESCAGEKARASVVQDLCEMLLRIAEHERPCAVALTTRPFTIAEGELTSNLKVRRCTVEIKRAALIQRLYDEIDERGNSSEGQLILFE